MSTVEKKYLQAVSVMEKNNFTKAVKLFTDVLKDEPQHRMAQYMRGISYNRLGEYSQAEQDLTVAIQSRHVVEHAYTERALARLETKQFPLALEDANEAIRREKGNNLAAYYYRSVAYYNLHQFDEALKDVEDVLKIDNAYTDAHSLLSVIKLAIGDVKGALRASNTAIQLDKSNALHYRRRAEIYTKSNSLSLAIDDISKAIKLNATAEDYCKRSELYLSTWQLRRALDDANYAVKKWSKSSLAHLNLSKLNFTIGSGGAWNFADKAIKLDPKSGEALLWYGNILLADKKYREASGESPLEVFKKAQKLMGDDPRSLYYIGLAHFQQGNIDLAKSVWKSYMESTSKNAYGMMNIRYFLFKISDKYPTSNDESDKMLQDAVKASMDKSKKEHAYQLFLKLIQMNPKNFNAYNNLAQFLLAEGKLKDALKYADKAIEIFPASYTTYLIRGQIYQEMEMWAESLRDFDIAFNSGCFERDPSTLMAYYEWRAKTLSSMNK